MTYQTCNLCPRQCGVDRTAGKTGFCSCPDTALVAKSMLHKWEEPALAGSGGSGAVFFGGCTLSCAFCQNREISRHAAGRAVSAARLADIFRELVAQGAHNVNLVSPTPYALAIREALETPLDVPVVWNTGGYERVETLRAMEGRVQIWLPDLKYADHTLAETYSGAPDYFEQTTAAIAEMYRQVGPYVMEDGLLKSGVVIRHLMLPGALANTKAVMDWVAGQFKPGEILFSLMAQYTPQENAQGLLARRVTKTEYRAALVYAENLGITDGYQQDTASAQSEYTPSFDLTGIE